MKSIREENWIGWNPSASYTCLQGDGPPELLRMDNLNIDEKGVCRKTNGVSWECTDDLTATTGAIYGLFSTYLNGKQVRFIYAQDPAIPANRLLKCTDGDIKSFSVSLSSASQPVNRAGFINALGQVFIVAGGIQWKYDGVNSSPLNIPAPGTPSVLVNPTNKVDMNNLSAGAYTNWISDQSATFSNTSNVGGTPANVGGWNLFKAHTTFSSPLDTTNLGGTGNDTEYDIFNLTFKIVTVADLKAITIRLYDSSLIQNYFFDWEMDHEVFLDPNSNPYPGLPLINNTDYTISLRRKDFYTPPSLEGLNHWNDIKKIEVTVTYTGGGTSICYFKDISISGGKLSQLTGAYRYIAVQVNNAGTYMQFSPGSTAIRVSANLGNITITPAGACNSQCNEWWLFRLDEGSSDNFYFVGKKTGAYGFTPSALLDTTSLEDNITAANINPFYRLEYYRTNIPASAKDMIWFRDRMIYLTDTGFIPSYKLDPGSYDSRFTYNLVGSNSEKPLFIAKLDVGTFIVATTQDFYRITGTFATLFDPNDPSGQVEYQDVNIIPLGIADPPVSRAFVENQGTIMYVSNTGIRVLANGVSTLINDNLDLLFRGEYRYGIPHINLEPFDKSLVSVASQGTRIYWSLPCADGVNKIFVLDLKNNNRNWRYWGNFSNGYANLFLEPDGKLICSQDDGEHRYLWGLESPDDLVSSNIYLETRYNYGDSYETRKTPVMLKCKINTYGNSLSLAITGLDQDGATPMLVKTISTLTDFETIEIDLKDSLQPCLCYSFQLSGLATKVSLDYIELLYEERPPLVLRAIHVADELGTGGYKRVASWPVVLNTFGSRVADVTVRADGVAVSTQSVITPSDTPFVFYWLSPDARRGRVWEIEVSCATQFEFYKFLPPVIEEKCPDWVTEAKFPASNFGSDTRKRISIWPIRLNAYGVNVVLEATVDGVVLAIENFTGTVNGPETYEYVFPNMVGTDFSLRVISNDKSVDRFEFYEFLQPVFAEVMPPQLKYVKFGANNFGSSSRKVITSLPFRANLRYSTVIYRVTIDGDVLPDQILTGGDTIGTYDFVLPNGLAGQDWLLELITTSGDGIEFYEWLPPVIVENKPSKTYYAVLPTTNFGKANYKIISAIPFMVNTLGYGIIVKVWVDGFLYATKELDNPKDEIKTLFWLNESDHGGIDWKVEIFAPFGMEFYKFLTPDVQQILPLGRLWDQIGPIDFEGQAFVDAIRFRIQGNSAVTYYVYEDGDLAYTGILAPSAKDMVYYEQLPKGINPTVCRVILSAPTTVNRYSIEYHVVGITGRETEGKFIKVKDVDAVPK